MRLPRPLSRHTAELLSEQLRALGHPLRLQLIDHIDRLPHTTVQELGELFGVSEQNVSAHLSILHHAGIIARHKDGTHVRYQLVDPSMIALLDSAMQSVAHHANALSPLAESNEP